MKYKCHVSVIISIYYITHLNTKSALFDHCISIWLSYFICIDDFTSILYVVNHLFAIVVFTVIFYAYFIRLYGSIPEINAFCFVIF